MKNVKNYEDFINENYEPTNEGMFKSLAAAALIGLTSLAPKIGTASTIFKKDKQTSHLTRQVKTDAEKNKLLQRGWVIDSVTVENMIDNIESDAEVVNIKLDFGQNFKSGSWELSEESKKSIDSLINSIKLDDLTITNMEIESSTDKTPISANMTKRTGIKNNKELSEHRTQSIIDYLKAKKYVSGDNNVGSKILFEQGTKDDVTARYVTLNITAVRVVVPAETDQGDKTYHMSRDYETFSHTRKEKVKIKTNRFKSSQKGKIKAIACPGKH